MIKRAKITASGKVQEVGYRQKVKEIADQLGVSGTVMNMEDGTVEILCEGEEQILADFIGKIKIQEKEPRQFFPAIWVDNLDVKMGKATREFRAFRKKNVTMDDSLEDMSHEVGIARGIMTNMAQSLSTSTQTLIEVNDNQRKTLESIETLTDHTDENFNKM
jgi:acylphosphatase